MYDEMTQVEVAEQALAHDVTNLDREGCGHGHACGVVVVPYNVHSTIPQVAHPDHGGFDHSQYHVPSKLELVACAYLHDH